METSCWCTSDVHQYGGRKIVSERQDKIFVNCALGPSKSIRYGGDFVTAGFVSPYFTVILPGFQNNVVRYNGVFVL